MINLIIELLNKMSNIQIIPAFTDKKSPKKSYATYQILNINSADFRGYTEREYIKKDEKYLETTEYRIMARLQFDVYSETQEEALENSIELRELILFNARREIGRIDAGVVKSSEIKSLNELINAKYEYRCSFDIVFEYMKITKERELELIKEIELLVNEKHKSRIARRKK
ncbi:hypothetical protein JY403_10560 [Fusobacterium animalis]|uniref:phage neck terminator protein n=1 Tax=Fusobacterium animalis TaxID=76859 RepID=UPI001C6F10D4|nr:hypothetical protein [Fusobacterium animalis]QYR65698.1 hypothetical protein JY403_10560 [Fusobacterium animalis]